MPISDGEPLGEEKSTPIKSSVVATDPQPIRSPTPPLQPETIIALDMMKNIFSGTIVSLSPMQQQQIITEIKNVPSFLALCDLTPQQVMSSHLLTSPFSC